ncbi:MAG: hypothetical protein QM775_05940 [Pirellulales bacterium]
MHDLHATILHLLGFDHEEAHVPLRRTRFPAHGRARPRGEGIARLVERPPVATGRHADCSLVGRVTRPTCGRRS